MRKTALVVVLSYWLAVLVAPPQAAAQRNVWKFALANPNFLAGIAFFWVGDHPKLDFFKKEGVKMEWYGVSGAPACIQHLLREQVDSCALVQDQVLLQAAQGNKLPITFIYDYTYRVTNEFAVAPNSPYRTVADLRGKKIGVLSLAHDTFEFAKLVFKGLGIDPEGQQYLAAGFGAQAVEMLYRGQVDALVLFDIAWTVFKSVGKPVRVLPQPDFVAEVKAGPIIAARSEDVRKRPDVIVRTFRGVLKGALFTMENPEAALHMHWEMHPETIPKGLARDVAFQRTLAIINSRLPALNKDLAGVKYYGEFNPEGWRAYVKNILGLNPNKVNPAEFYTNQFAKDINDFDQKAFREWSRKFKY